MKLVAHSAICTGPAFAVVELGYRRLDLEQGNAVIDQGSRVGTSGDLFGGRLPQRWHGGVAHRPSTDSTSLDLYEGQPPTIQRSEVTYRWTRLGRYVPNQVIENVFRLNYH